MRCPGCGSTIQAAVFPAVRGPRTGELPEALGTDSEASCYFHPASRAAIPCEGCGRFLCRLCDLEVNGRHLCPSCFQKGVATRQLETVETRRVMYDSVALSFATFPMLLLSPIVIGAPAALYTVVRRWKAPSSVVPRTRVRFYIAALLALGQLALIGFVIWGLSRVRLRP